MANRRLNRRQHRRAQLSRRVQYIYGSRVFSHQLENISEGGICLRGATPLPMNKVVKIFVPLPKSDARRDRLCLVWGKVVWANEQAFGVEFVEAPLESMLQVREFIQLAA